MTTPTWKDEIQYGALSETIAPYFAAGDDYTVTQILNEKTIDVIRTIDRRTFVGWCASTGMRAVIQDVSVDTSSPSASLRSSALAMLDIILGGGTDGINFTDPDNITMLDYWVYFGKLSAPNKEALLTLATIKISRAEFVMGRDATINDVSAIRGQ